MFIRLYIKINQVGLSYIVLIIVVQLSNNYTSSSISSLNTYLKLFNNILLNDEPT